MAPAGMLNADLAKYVPAGDANWAAMMVSLKAATEDAWPFNTECCATEAFVAMATCHAQL